MSTTLDEMTTWLTLQRGYSKELGLTAGVRIIDAVLAELSALPKFEEIARDNGDSAEMSKARLASIKEIIDTIENRCMAADGPVTNTRNEMTDEELQRIYRLAGGTVQS
jgi:hypothetical protein